MASLPGGYGIRPYSLPLAPLCEGAPPAGGGGENCTAARNISGYGKVLSLRPFGAPLPLWRKRHLPRIGGACLAEGGQRVKKHRLFYIENVGATIGRPPAWRSNALSEMAFLQGIRARASNARPYRSFSTVCPKGYRAVVSHYYYDAIRLILQ